MGYRICKSFHVESGHMLSKHPGLCKFPHGHSREVQVVLSASTLDAGDMVCDFKVVKLALAPYLSKLDHAMAINSRDPRRKQLESESQSRLMVYEDADPTTEVMAERLFKALASELRAGKTYTDDRGDVYGFPPGVKLERVRVSETASTWAEYSGE